MRLLLVQARNRRCLKAAMSHHRDLALLRCCVLCWRRHTDYKAACELMRRRSVRHRQAQLTLETH